MTPEAGAIIRVDDHALTLGAFALQPTGLVITGAPSFADWQACGDVLRRVEGAVQWWIGDWLNYGEHAYGEKYTAAVAATHFEQSTLQNFAYVAQNVRFSLRSENVSWTIHKEVAPLLPDRQAAILERAAAESLTVSDVRELIRTTAHADKVAAIAAGALPAGEFDIVAADPPWAYDNSGFTQSAAAHYPTLPVDRICRLPEDDATFPKFADPCVLFLWATSPLLPDALRVLEAWGFTYKASMVWLKDRAPGLGWWVETRHELIVIGVRGAGRPPLERVDSVFEAGVEAHSRKPDIAYAAIDRMFPGLRRVECFARSPRDGWEIWGNEV